MKKQDENKIDPWWLEPWNKEEYDAYYTPKKLTKIEKAQNKNLYKKKKIEDFWEDIDVD